MTYKVHHHLWRFLVLAFSIVGMGLLMLPQAQVHAAEVTYIANIDSNSPTFIRPHAPNNFATTYACNQLTASRTAFYQLEQLVVDTTGEYTIETTRVIYGDNDPLLLLYADSFNPNDTWRNCLWYNDDGGPGLLALMQNIMLEAGRTYYIALSYYPSNVTGSFEVRVSGVGTPTVSNVTPTSTTSAQQPFAGCTFDDERINDDPQRDCAPPVAVYCNADDVMIYRVDSANSAGAYLFSMAQDELNATAIPQNENVVIVTYEDITIWRLTTGEFQLNTWQVDPSSPSGVKPYILVWTLGCGNVRNITP